MGRVREEARREEINKGEERETREWDKRTKRERVEMKCRDYMRIRNWRKEYP